MYAWIITTLEPYNVPNFYDILHPPLLTHSFQVCIQAIKFMKHYIFFLTDNTNIKKKLLCSYVSIAHSTGYHIVLVEPKTSWKYSISDLAQKNHHNVTEEILREQLSEFEQIVAVYYGWFLSEDSSRTLKDRMFKVLSDCCVKIPSFKNSLVEDTGQDDHGKLNTKRIFVI